MFIINDVIGDLPKQLRSKIGKIVLTEYCYKFPLPEKVETIQEGYTIKVIEYPDDKRKWVEDEISEVLQGLLTDAF